MSDTNKEEDERGTNRGVDTILNGRENSDKYHSQPDQELEGRNTPEGVDLGGIGDQIQNSVNYYRGYASCRNPDKGWGETTTTVNIPERGVCMPDLDLRAERENDPVTGCALNTVPMVLVTPMAMSS